MADTNLAQTEANALLAMEKHRANEAESDFPMRRESMSLPLHALDKHEQFFLDLSRGRIDLHKVKMQNRARQVIVLARLDLGGAPHRNPDDQEVAAPHLHLYREGYGDKWAFPLPPRNFQNPRDHWITYLDFLRFCNITQPPHVRRTLIP